MKSDLFEGKVTIITGSSRGIGKGIALELAKRGANIVLNGRNAGRLAEVENEIRKINNRVISICCDISTTEGGQYLIDEAVKAYGQIDILVNNVGVSMRGNVADLNPVVFKNVFESNVMVAVNPTIPALKHLRKTQGSIIFISSLVGIRGLPGLSAYCSSKMALRAIAESLRIEEAKYKLHVGLILVGFTEIVDNKETIIADGSSKTLEPRSGKGVQSIESVARAVAKNISKRKYISILSPLGKVNAFLQPRFPLLVERIILKNLKRFEEQSS
jgi:short-subunit dehydrogenase